MGTNVPRPTTLIPFLIVMYTVCLLGIESRSQTRHRGMGGAIEPNPPHDAKSGFSPDFVDEVNNLTIPIGRDATFTCQVKQLGGYRVGWVKSDTKAIQAIHNHVITHNPRVSVSHTNLNSWSLHIDNVQEEDGGEYMCQVNTDPMKSQTGILNIVIPPDFVSELTSGDTVVMEGGNVRLTCKAVGRPDPNVTWRREDGRDIILKDPLEHRIYGQKFVPGSILHLPRIARNQMGAYLCIASNGVPPTVSKRVVVNVHFHPVISVPNQLVGAPFGTDVTLECKAEAFPKPIAYWVTATEKRNPDGTYSIVEGEMIVPTSAKYELDISATSAYETTMKLTIKNFQVADRGSYKCIAKNSLGDVESSIRLYDIPKYTKKVVATKPREDVDSENEVYGSADERQNQINSNDINASYWDEKNASKIRKEPRYTTEPPKKAASGSITSSAIFLLPVMLMFPAI